MSPSTTSVASTSRNMRRRHPPAAAFVSAAALPARPHHRLRPSPPPAPTSRRTVRRVTRSQLSSPFPDPDPFAVPSPAFRTLTSSYDLRPELLGALLLSVGLYLGFSQRVRWADALRDFLASRLLALRLPPELSETVADVLHPFPFLALGVALDAVLRATAGGNAVWAVATGLSTAMYAGVYELGRQAAANSALDEAEEAAYNAFVDFADSQLDPKGMCHFMDVRDAVRRQAAASPKLRNLSDEMIRRFVLSRFPRAKRSPNGYYRGLSIRAQRRAQRPGGAATSDETPPSSPPQ